MSRRRLRRKSVKAKPRVDPLRALFDELAQRTPARARDPRHNGAAPAVRRTQRVERLAYTRTQAAAALGMTPATFARRVLPLIETVEMPWGKQLVPVDELERLLAERRRPARARGTTDSCGPPADAARRRRQAHRRGYDAGKSLGQIARDLNADGVPTAHGGAQWWPSTVRVVLRGRAAARLAARTGS